MAKIFFATDSPTEITDKRLPFLTTNNSSPVNFSLSVDKKISKFFNIKDFKL